MESGTALRVDQDADTSGCVVDLSYGKLLVSVNRADHEGLFRIITPQADLTVTGTVFAVAVSVVSTQLSVIEGSVQLAPKQGAAQVVSANQTYETDGNALVRVDTTSAPPADLLAGIIDPVDLLQQSPWYRKRFAPLLELGDYLRAKGVEVDETALLSISADLWCLQYPKQQVADLPPFIHRKSGLERAAKFYGHQVTWLTPANQDEMAQQASHALAAKDLVLAFGVKGRDVEAIEPDQVKGLGNLRIEPYRFLGEEKAFYQLAQITRSEEPTVSRESLARESVGDTRWLLTTAEDQGYWLGQEAVEEWGKAISESGEDIALNDPILQSLNAIGIIGIQCAEHCVSLGGDVSNLSRMTRLCQQLDKHTHRILNSLDLEATDCWKQQESKRQLICRDIIASMYQVWE